MRRAAPAETRPGGVRCQSLFLSVFLGVSLSGFFRVLSCVSGVARGRMGVMGGLLVKASFVVFGSFTMMAGCMGMMLRSLLMVLRRFFGHGVLPIGLAFVAPGVSAGVEASSAVRQKAMSPEQVPELGDAMRASPHARHDGGKQLHSMIGGRPARHYRGHGSPGHGECQRKRRVPVSHERATALSLAATY